MYFSTKWFLFIEWSIMMIFWWMWVLSAALFPSMTSYLERSRDAGRTASLNTIATAIWAYYSDKEKYPESDPSGCIPKQSLNTGYLPRGIPTDPKKETIHEGCTNPGEYVYRGFRMKDLSPAWAIGATLEWKRWWNSAKSLGEYTQEELESGVLRDSLLRWSGRYYILTD
jgi:Tfp pilus assembly protein PilE